MLRISQQEKIWLVLYLSFLGLAVPSLRSLACSGFGGEGVVCKTSRGDG